MKSYVIAWNLDALNISLTLLGAGMNASIAYERVTYGDATEEGRAPVRADLSKYCNLDTEGISWIFYGEKYDKTPLIEVEELSGIKALAVDNQGFI